MRTGREGREGQHDGGWLLGVDIGAGSVKALAATLDGRPNLDLYTQVKSLWVDLS